MLRYHYRITLNITNNNPGLNVLQVTVNLSQTQSHQNPDDIFRKKIQIDPTWRMKEQETDGKNVDQRWISHEYGRYRDSV